MKKSKSFLKENIFLAITLVISLSLLFFIKENILRVLVLELLIWFWYYLGKRFKNFTYTSFLLFWIVLPFNIAIQVYFSSIDPYVNGIFTNYLVPTISILDLFGILLLISSILEGKISKKGFSWDILCLLVFSLLQFFVNKEIVSLLGIARISCYLLVFRTVSRNINLKGDTKFLRVTEVLILIQVVIALLQFLSGSSIGISFLGESVFSAGMKGSNFIDIAGNLYIRGYGTFPHPNILAGWFLMSMVFLWKNKRSLVFLLLSSLGIALTFSRVGIFLLAVFWILYIFQYLKTKKKTMLFSFYGLVHERVLNLFNGGDSAVADRVNLLKQSINIFKTNWLMGTGYNSFVKEMGSNMPRTANGVLLNQPVHNVFMLSLCELGILGTALVGISYWKTFFKKKVNLKSLRNIFITICLISIGMVDHYLFSLPQGIAISMFLLYFLSRGLKVKKTVKRD